MQHALLYASCVCNSRGYPIFEGTALLAVYPKLLSAVMVKLNWAFRGIKKWFAIHSKENILISLYLHNISPSLRNQDFISLYCFREQTVTMVQCFAESWGQDMSPKAYRSLNG